MIRRFQKNVKKTCKGLEYVLAQRYPAACPPIESKPSSFLDKDKIRERAMNAKDFAASKTVPTIFAAKME